MKVNHYKNKIYFYFYCDKIKIKVRKGYGMDNNIDALLLNINDMTKSVNKQIEDSEEELRTQTRLLTFHDKLISDEMLLSLPPDVLQNSLPDDEFDEFLEKYPDYVTKHELKKDELKQDETIIEKQNENQENIDQIDQEPKQSTEISDEPILDSPQDKTEEIEEQIVNENIVTTKSVTQNKKENNWKNNLVTVGIIGTIVIILKILLSF